MEEHEFYPMFLGNHCMRPWFRGTFACDEIGQETASPGLYVVNTAPRSSFGEHWVIFYVCPKDKTISYFDSFEMIPIHGEFYTLSETQRVSSTPREEFKGLCRTRADFTVYTWVRACVAVYRSASASKLSRRATTDGTSDTFPYSCASNFLLLR